MRSYGSVRGASGNGRPYRDSTPIGVLSSISGNPRDLPDFPIRYAKFLGRVLEQLIEQTGFLYHLLVPLVGGVWRSSRPGAIRQRPIPGELFFCLSQGRICLGQEWREK